MKTIKCNELKVNDIYLWSDGSESKVIKVTVFNNGKQVKATLQHGNGYTIQRYWNGFKTINIK